jgi:hypothetical protein
LDAEATSAKQSHISQTSFGSEFLKGEKPGQSLDGFDIHCIPYWGIRVTVWIEMGIFGVEGRGIGIAFSDDFSQTRNPRWGGVRMVIKNMVSKADFVPEEVPGFEVPDAVPECGLFWSLEEMVEGEDILFGLHEPAGRELGFFLGHGVRS